MVRRAVALAFVLSTCVVHFWLMRLKGPRTPERRARWLQRTCNRILRSMGIRCDVVGEIPRHGLVAANHLSYLDIVILSAAMPCFFVAKAEIDAWPYFGRAARAGGTIFIDRSRRMSAEQVAAEMERRLELPVPVLFFPEGTSTDGNMLPFHARLFEPAVRCGAPVTAASVQYVMDDGTPERELCWYGDDALAPHLLKTLRTPGFHARLHFGAARTYAHRREAADETFAEIAAMRAGELAEKLQTA